MPLMRHELAARHLRAMREARAHGPSDNAHGHTLQLRQNIAPEIDAIERPVIAPRYDGASLLRRRCGTALLRFRRRCRIVAGRAHAGDFRRPRGPEISDRSALGFFAPLGQALIAKQALADCQLSAAACPVCYNACSLPASVPAKLSVTTLH